ncbi:UDP-glucosyltransferase 2-like [Tigriopus californicus]|uniref:UDP-glucosyltransferase 2-like n=1 Tax=Tigriopus californicus TaxID=6832 RepID=UPI0027DA5AF0|nr:UDP-glucosyltransferase 2-like [Tigriopus californicus]
MMRTRGVCANVGFWAYWTLCIWSYSCVESASILMYFPISTPSHKNVFRPLAEALAEQGHQVTVVTSIPDLHVKDNVTEIHVKLSRDLLYEMGQVATSQNGDNHSFRLISVLMNIRNCIYEAHLEALQHPEIRTLLLDPNTKFDLTFVFPLFNEVGYFLAKRFRSPLVLYMPAVANSLLTTSLGYFDNPTFATTSTYEMAQSETPGLFHRLIAIIIHLGYHHMKQWAFVNTQESLLKDLNISHGTDLLQLESEASFGMYFSHFAFDSIRPTLPNTIDIGLIHCVESKNLSTELSDWLNGEDFIFVSFGSWISTDHLTLDSQSILWETLQTLPVKVVLKVGKNSDRLRSNDRILTGTWFPQQDLLGHPSCRLFISQGGMMSLQESVFHGVPILIIPFFGDQFANAQRAARQGYGRKLEIQDLSHESLRESIMDILQNGSYRDQTQQVRSLLIDDISTPLEKAVFWSEYLIRHQGAMHLNFPGKHVGCLQFFHLDIWLTMGLVISLLCYLLWKMSSWCLRKFL